MHVLYYMHVVPRMRRVECAYNASNVGTTSQTTRTCKIAGYAPTTATTAAFESQASPLEMTNSIDRRPIHRVNLIYECPQVCHIHILTSEARKQAELLYGLAALSKHIRGT